MDKHSFPNGKRLVRDALKHDDNLHYEKFSDGTVKCIEDEIPFELPNGWIWNRGHSCFKGMKSLKPQGKYFDYIDIDAIDNKLHKISAAKHLLVKEAPSRASRKLENGSVLFSFVRPYLENIAFVNEKFSHCIASTGFYVCNSNGILNPNFMFVLMTSKYVIDGLNSFMKGNNSPSIRKEEIENFLYPIPPIYEQKRIINKINAMFPIIKNLAIQKNNLKKESISFKSKILDLAIRGKLVPQDPNDEPASVLLERIRVEKEELIKQGKIKRNKKESVIFKGSDNSYYQDLPKNWEICSIMAIAEVDLGKTLDKNKNTGKFYPYLRSVNIKWNEIDLSDIKEMQFEKNELQRYSIIKGDLLICEGGDVGRCCIWSSDETIYYQNALHRVRFHGGCEPKYFLYFMMYLEHTGYLKRISNGVTIKHLTKTVLTTIPFMLPPLAEQKRIVDEIEKIFAILDNIANQVA